MTALRDRISRCPRADDAARGDEAAAAVGETGAAADLIRGAAGSSPYLADLVRREADWLREALGRAPADALADIFEQSNEIGGARDTAARLRIAKRRAALLIALADLGGVWSLEETTGALSDFADHVVEIAFAQSLLAETSGPLAGQDAAEAGLIALAMGKGGARELNYSSDIDLILFHDDERLSETEAMEAKPRWNKVAQRAVKLLTEQTAEGYVFRVDLRLRPNPSVTPVCMGVEAAERYYESLGRTWERAAFIKARPCAGDLEAGEAFLRQLSPFVWRRHLDFAALEDINDIRAKIRAAKGLGGRDDLPGYNLKLGPGGIREIEFFAQTQQLALGGRDPNLRARGTLAALSALTAAGRVTEDDCAALAAAYRAHREVEHRLQMIADQQTHDMPVGAEARAQVAALGGWPDRETMETEVAARLSDVRRRVSAFFGDETRNEAAQAHVADAVDEEAFDRPEMIGEMVERWSEGGVAATRDERARRKFKALAPGLLRRLASASAPDEAALQFDRFISGLPAGVQLFSLFEANPQLLDLIAEICAAAPRLAAYLGRNSRVLDAVLDRDFFAPLPDRAALSDELRAALDGERDFETVLDKARIWASERRFRLGVQVLRGVADEAEAGRGFSDIAETCLEHLATAVADEIGRRHGPPPGRGAAVLAMGKLGSREMTASSDLDLIVIYDAAGAEASEGPKPLTTQAYFARFTKALVSALTTLTSEGALYEVDMRLRPSGGQGPVAVSLASFAAYQAEEAWTWEHMALTRARPVVGDAGLCADISDVIARVLAAPRDREATARDVLDMHQRLTDANRSARSALWSLKHGAGGLMDIEFVAQRGALRERIYDAPTPRLTLSRLREAGALAPDDAAALIDAHALQSALQQVERVAIEGAFRPEEPGEGLRAALARAIGAPDFETAAERLEIRRAAASAVAARILRDVSP